MTGRGGAVFTVVTANNCTPRSADTLIDGALTTVTLLTPGTYQACVAVVDGNLSGANAWLTFNVTACIGNRPNNHEYQLLDLPEFQSDRDGNG